jgi:hypothetical protein
MRYRKEMKRMEKNRIKENEKREYANIYRHGLSGTRRRGRKSIMKNYLLLLSVLLFHTNGIKAENIEIDTINYASLNTYIFSDETTNNCFCYDEKLTINKGIKEDCIREDKFIKSIFVQITNSNEINFGKLDYCVKTGRLFLSGDTLQPIIELWYYVLTFNKKDTFIQRYYSILDNKMYEKIYPVTKFPTESFLFIKDEKLVILFQEVHLIVYEDGTMVSKSDLDIQKVIESVRRK